MTLEDLSSCLFDSEEGLKIYVVSIRLSLTHMRDSPSYMVNKGAEVVRDAAPGAAGSHGRELRSAATVGRASVSVTAPATVGLCGVLQSGLLADWHSNWGSRRQLLVR